MIDAVQKGFFNFLSQSALLKRLASRYGMASPGSFARRFIAGETVQEAIEAAKTLQARGFDLTLDYLGESVRTHQEADAAAREYVHLIDVLMASGIERNLSLKLTQLGAGVDKATCVDNLRRILEAAERHEFFVRIDMESSAYTDLTLDVFETLWTRGHHNLGVVIQSALKRSEADVARVTALGGRIRLVKGAYKEPPEVAYASKADVDAAFVRLMQQLLDSGQYPAIASHDPKMIDATLDYAEARSVPPSQFEFQMLYGVRRDLQRALSSDGYRVRVYVPFGREWFPYFMRRLGERPANVAFVIRAMLRDRGAA
ncbi:MAG TPA: proline dehydrogenase family protein [Vicinamibacterales bacterium]|nr:proline dehydrogenase family protein [Vicinamibacterales bacterium]